RFLYLAPSAAVVAIDDLSAALLDAVASGPRDRHDLQSALGGRDAGAEIAEPLDELVRMRALRPVAAPLERVPKVVPLTPIPLSTMVLNVTNQCNLSCTYCYEYGDDRIVDTGNGKQPKWMSEETA